MTCRSHCGPCDCDAIGQQYKHCCPDCRVHRDLLTKTDTVCYVCGQAMIAYGCATCDPYWDGGKHQSVCETCTAPFAVNAKGHKPWINIIDGRHLLYVPLWRNVIGIRGTINLGSARYERTDPVRPSLVGMVYGYAYDGTLATKRGDHLVRVPCTAQPDDMEPIIRMFLYDNTPEFAAYLATL